MPSPRMLLRRRCSLSNCLSWFAVSAIALVFALACTIFYGTRTENPSLPSLVKELLPAGRCLCQHSTTFQCESCLDCTSRPAIPANATSEQDEAWVYNYHRDGGTYGLDEHQCLAAFPGLFEDIHRAKKYRQTKGNNITESELSGFKLSKGMVRALIHDGKVCIQPFLSHYISHLHLTLT
jgi:hypothetical protein